MATAEGTARFVERAVQCGVHRSNVRRLGRLSCTALGFGLLSPRAGCEWRRQRRQRPCGAVAGAAPGLDVEQRSSTPPRTMARATASGSSGATLKQIPDSPCPRGADHLYQGGDMSRGVRCPKELFPSVPIEVKVQNPMIGIAFSPSLWMQRSEPVQRGFRRNRTSCFCTTRNTCCLPGCKKRYQSLTHGMKCISHSLKLSRLWSAYAA